MIRTLRRGLPALLSAAALGLAVMLAATPADARVRSERHSFTEAGPTRVLILGDSNIYGHLGRVLEDSLIALGFEVVRFAKPTAGLARPDFFNLQLTSDVLVSLHQPDVVIMMFGGNDGQRLEPHGTSGGRVHWKDEEVWLEEYGHRMRRLARTLRGDRRQAIFLSPTNRRPRIAREKMHRIRRAQQLGVQDMERVAWIDMFPFTSDARGRWLKAGLDVFGRYVSYRRGDGVHLSPEGGLEVGRRLLPALLEHGLSACEEGTIAEIAPLPAPSADVATTELQEHAAPRVAHK